jgi:hypothetical protein
MLAPPRPTLLARLSSLAGHHIRWILIGVNFVVWAGVLVTLKGCFQ